jgi:hypothetical protein
MSHDYLWAVGKHELHVNKVNKIRCTEAVLADELFVIPGRPAPTQDNHVR